MLVRTGIGLTTTVTLNVSGLVQLLYVKVYLYVTVMGNEVLLISCSFGLPVPDVGPTGVIPGTEGRVQE